ncbi:glycosyltransferase [Methylorubrum salsuginis]|uniref:Glycosyltransferase, catalytic subunit of cellulose synthase and poly-beta-1,6-N-acetylglucosamine synthase n=1 Tax=Methylorubrum salsuginis TaxID=414703 RepID=A0A1I3Z5X5_9HYPH|nr:glycosyltransferase [Methylorubrum salsuginis]SFK39071.1 Glycosyltransferase, catalytic subunit of cellulose synthase and poly-beta-1,6-N-acetylglucosamine synthase [Methylorubrum salsuginis]
MLLNEGRIAEDDFYRALARRLGSDFLDGPIRLGEGLRYPQVLTVGAAPLAAGHAQKIVAAPRGTAIARLIEAAPRLEHRPAITTPTRLREAVFAQYGTSIVEEAADGLTRRRPEWSCRPGPRTLDLTLAGLVFACVLLLTRLPTLTGLILLMLIQAGMLAMLTVRLAAAGIAGTAVEPASDLLPDEALPTYTVLVALHREAAVLHRLVYSLARLDYPAAKLDIKFLLEVDDAETRTVLRAVPLPARFEVVVVPDGQPRTKPRALNAGLPLARGEHLVVYDAEDVIAPDQLRRAATLFARAPASTACLQGHLVIDNPGDGLLQRLFAIEYAALFEVLGPALAAWRVPTPLGGTSTHFRTRVLRELHGWDAWNVTEDADLGMRLALAGYHVGDLPSATYEEAPKHLKAWLRQRTRWMKGFLQTSFTHARDPLATWRRLGAVESLCALALLPGTVASALFYPFMMGPGLAELILGAPGPEAGLLTHATYAGAWTIFLGGLAAILIPGFIGCHRRGWRDLMGFVPLLPFYFLLVSAAAWLAVIELARHPHRWNKTEHGLSRTSRSGALGRGVMSGVTAACSAPRPSPSAAG